MTRSYNIPVFHGIATILVAALCSPGFGAVKQVTSILLAAPSGTQIRHAGTRTFLNVDAGAELQPGDAIRSSTQAPKLLGCTSKDDASRNVFYELSPSVEIVFGNAIPPEARNVQHTEVRCTLPLDDRSLSATMDKGDNLPAAAPEV